MTTPEPASVVPLPADLGIEHAAELQAQLAPHLYVGGVTLAAGEVSRVHTAALQVLGAFVRSRAAGGHATAWQNPSPELREACARLGLDSLLGLPPGA